MEIPRLDRASISEIYPRTSPEKRRITRVCFWILVLGLLNVYDLGMTVRAVQLGVMMEANPIADYVIQNHGVMGLSLYKTLCVGSALVLFCMCRRFAVAEWSCLGATALYSGVAIAWLHYPIDELFAHQFLQTVTQHDGTQTITTHFVLRG